LALPALNSTLRFGDYDVDALLGPGSVTETYRASRNGGSAVALKLLRQDRGGSDPAVRAAFVAVAKRNKTLRLPGLAKVLEIQDTPNDVFFVSELLDGVNLEGLFDSATASGSMDPQLVGQMGVQIARVLTRLHERREPIIHGGLCPSNVIVTSGGRVTLVDAGVSAALRPLTELPVDRGWFVAPEVILDGEVPTIASDVYGLGAVLYYLLTGEPPVMGETVDELRELFDEGPPSVPGLPDWLEDSLLMMLARDPSDRPRSAAAVALSLNPFPEGATRLGAIVSGNTPAPVSVSMPNVARSSEFDPMLGHGTMVVGADDGQSLSALSLEDSNFDPGPGPQSDALENPFDSADSSPNGIALAAEPNEPIVLPPAKIAAAKSAPPQLTLTPLRPTAVLAPAEPASLGLSNEPKWADGDGVSIGLDTGPGWENKPPSVPSPSLENEPQWADGGASMVAVMRNAVSSSDDYLDLGPRIPIGGPSLGLGISVAKVELPDLDVDVAQPLVSSVVHVDDDPAPQGLVSFGKHATSAPVDLEQLGAIGFSEEDEDAAAASAAAGAGGIVIPQVPRRAGSARKGGASGGASATLLKAAVVLTLLGAGGLVALKVLSKPPTVLPSAEQLAKDDPAAKPAGPKATAQNPDEVAQLRGELSIITTPRGATIWVDGQEKGKTPLTVQTAPGTHRIVIVKPGFKMLREVTDTNEGLTIKRTLPPANINFGGNVVLKVECKTAGKYPVFIDGKDTGLLCPIEALKVPDGNRLIGLYVIPDNKIWSFEREVTAASKVHRVVFSY
jgi:serine/threonine protein kinase